jgi:hypothetical protein
MAQYIKQGNIFGRIGTGIGKGLAEQIPKEIERKRLASGLEQFEKEAANLSPVQQMARLSAIPGISPQMIQSFGELARQQNKANAFKGFGANRGLDENIVSSAQPAQPPKFPLPSRMSQQPAATESGVPSLTQEETLKRVQNPYIPPSRDEILTRSSEKFDANPALYDNNPQNAIAETEKEIDQEERRQAAFEKKHATLTAVQDNVIARLKDHSNNLGVKIPANVYSKIEDEAIQATKPKDQGGKGFTEQQAMKEYGKKLDEISRDYSNLYGVGDWIITRPAKNTLNSLRSLQKNFAARGDTENMADTLVARNKVSNPMAYSIAQPVSDIPALSQTLKQLPKITGTVSVSGGVLGVSQPKRSDIERKTLEVAEKLLPLLGKNGSPLAVAYELERKGYDPSTWIDYLIKNKDELSVAQGRQLDKPLNVILPLNDYWLGSWSGIE